MMQPSLVSRLKNRVSPSLVIVKQKESVEGHILTSVSVFVKVPSKLLTELISKVFVLVRVPESLIQSNEPSDLKSKL